jgi:hypothetical protein
MSPTKVALRAKLQEKRQASQTDWLAFQEAKKQGLAWSAPEPGVDSP